MSPRQKPQPCRECGDHVFDRDPALEVACPVCEAPVGVKCASVAPSGHRKSTGFSKLPPWGHDERDLLACAKGHYRHPCSVSETVQEGREYLAWTKLQRMLAEPPPAAVQEELFA